MSLLSLTAWSEREREHRDLAKGLGAEIRTKGQGNFRRIFLFSFPIFSKVARMDRERQLFNATMDEHVKNEHKPNAWGKRLFLGLVGLAILATLVFCPPETLFGEKFGKSVGILKARAAVGYQLWSAGFGVHARTPVKVWVNSSRALSNWLAKFRNRAPEQPVMTEQMRLAEVTDEGTDILRKLNVGARGVGLAAGDGVVIVLRGVAFLDKGSLVAPKDVVREGSTITTGPKSFVKLWFSDGSHVSVGPNSSLRLEPTTPGQPNVLGLLTGEMRAKVTKSTEKGADGALKEKLLIRTKTAAMGIRGTDFHVDFNPTDESTSLITFEGLVAMAKVDKPGDNPLTMLAATGAQAVGAGMSSQVRSDSPAASAPAAVIPAKLEILRAETDIQGAKESESQEQNLRFLQEVARTGELVIRGNSHSDLYQPIGSEDLEQLTRIISSRPPASATPKKEDYEAVRGIPARFKGEPGEFPRAELNPQLLAEVYFPSA